MFEKNLNAFKQFTELLRVGLPDDLIDLLNDNLDTSKPKSAKVATTTNTIGSSNHAKANVREVPDDLKGFVGLDFLIYSIPGDGSCLYGSASAHIYHDEHQVSNLRRLIHHHIFNNWWYYSSFIPLPFKETVGVGSSSFQVNFETEGVCLIF